MLVSDVIRFLQAKDVKSALLHLNILKQQISSDTSNASIEPIKILVSDAIQNLQSNDTNGALIHLNIVMQELGEQATTDQMGLTNSISTGPATNPTRPAPPNNIAHLCKT